LEADKFWQVGGGKVISSEQFKPVNESVQLQVSLRQIPFPLQKVPLLKQGGVKTEQSSPVNPSSQIQVLF
jgi:hypothetical protein